ncbi:MAG: hypothetical protein ACQEQG_05585 [Bacillota bacterium]
MVTRLDRLVEVKLNKILAEISPTLPPAVDASGKEGESEQIPVPEQKLLSELATLNPGIQKKLLETWLAAQLPIEPEKLLDLIKYISSVPIKADQEALIEAAAFLKKNHLPVRSFFLEALAYERFPDQPMVVKNPTDLLKLVDPDFLREYLNQTDNPSKIASHQLLNLVDIFSSDQKLLLYFELPLLLFENQEPGSLRFRLSEEKTENLNQVQQKKIYQINFILDLNPDFTVRADITIAKPEVFSIFILNSSRYRPILTNSIPELRQKLAQLGYNLNPTQIKISEDLDKRGLRRDILNSSREFGADLKLKDLLQKYHNVDFKA